MKIERLDLNNRIKAQKNQKLKPLVQPFSFEIFCLIFVNTDWFIRLMTSAFWSSCENLLNGFKVCIVITSKVCKDFPRESANTFAPSKVCIDFHSAKTLDVITPEFRFESLYLSDFQSKSLQRLWR